MSDRIWLRETREEDGWKFGYWADRPQDAAFVEYARVPSSIMDEVDEWVEATGCVPFGGSWHAEIKAFIVRAATQQDEVHVKYRLSADRDQTA